MSEMSIAIVDDHQLIRSGLRELIASMSAHKVVIEAADGSELISKMAEQQPDLVLLDIKMKGMNGVETLDFLKKNHPDVKVIILTMMEEEHFIVDMIRKGVNAYLIKNTPPEELIAALQGVQRQGSYFNDTVTRALVNTLSLPKPPAPDSNGQSRSLDDRDIQLLRYLSNGLSNQQISLLMHLSKRTIEGRRQKLLEKTNTRNTAQLIAYAFRNKILPLE